MPLPNPQPISSSNHPLPSLPFTTTIHLSSNVTPSINSFNSRESESCRSLSPLRYEATLLTLTNVHHASTDGMALDLATPVVSIAPASSPFTTAGAATAHKLPRRRERHRRSAPPVFKKLLWVRQSFPDNYTDASTFLDHLQRNPKLQPYEFWRLVADSTVIVQQVCSVAIFISCFTGISQERVNPLTIVGCATILTVICWVIWNIWITREEEPEKTRAKSKDLLLVVDHHDARGSVSSSTTHTRNSSLEAKPGPGFSPLASDYTSHSSPTFSTLGGSMRQESHHFDFEPTVSDTQSPSQNGLSEPEPLPSLVSSQVYHDPSSTVSPQNQQRLTTIKSASLIYCAVLGMSPILKSLTKSTSSDSIWAISSWLMIINLFFFDYSGGPGAQFPGSLSTNAALMASTVLASRLASTTHVFLLTLFSIQVFGLFPIFRRYLRHVSHKYHNLLTLALVLGAGGGLAVAVNMPCSWYSILIGCSLGLLTAALAMGGASWWLIGLQRRKDDIVGPWDVARPRLRRRRWE